MVVGYSISRYDDEAREVAIDEARQLAKRGRVEATKVVQEDYDEGTHFVRESNRLRGRALDRFNQLRSADNDGTGEPNYLGELQRNVGHDHADQTGKNPKYLGDLVTL